MNSSEYLPLESSPATLDSTPSLVPKQRVSNDDIVYGALLSGASPKEKYTKNKNEVALTGDSQEVVDQIAAWEQEQRAVKGQDLEAILADPKISYSKKRDILKQQLISGENLRPLRDKYLIKQAATDNAVTEADREAQDIYSETVLVRDEKNKAIAIAKAEEEARKNSFWGQFLDSMAEQQLEVARGQKVVGETVGVVGSQIALSIPAGLGAIAQTSAGALARLTNTFAWAQEYDAESASKMIDIVKNYVTKDAKVTEDTGMVLGELQNVAENLDVPFKWLADKDFEMHGSPASAAAIYTLSQAIGYGGAFAIGSRAIKSHISKVRPEVPKGSPLDTAEIANKPAASVMALEVIKDPTEVSAEALKVSKEAIVNEYYLPKIEETYGPIHPDARKELIDSVSEELSKLYDETEMHTFLSPVSQIRRDREIYLSALTETTSPHLLLSSSVIGTTGEAFGRKGTGVEAKIDLVDNVLTGTAMYGRNSNFGYNTLDEAKDYAEILKEQTNHLPHVEPKRNDISVLERDGQFYVKMEFKKEYNGWENLSFGADTLSAHLLHPKFDITWAANTWIGDKIWPSYMRMKQWIPSVGTTTGWKEARIEGAFLNAQRDLFINTKFPKELIAVMRKGEKEGKVYTSNDFQTLNQHLTKVQAEQLHADYVGFRLIQDHLYRFADRNFRRKLQDTNNKTLYDETGNRVGFAEESPDIPSSVTHIWDMAGKQIIPMDGALRVVKLKDPVRSGEHLLNYASIPMKYQFGGIVAGSLNKIPGYVPRYYKEWFVIDEVPTTLVVDGVPITGKYLEGYKSAVAMSGTRSELTKMLGRMQKENPGKVYSIRKEQKNIEDVIIHDSEIYTKTMAERHARGEAIPAFNREADTEDLLVAQTRSIKSVAKVTAWGELDKVFRKNFVKEFGDFLPNGRFPGAIQDIKPTVAGKMSELDEPRFLAAQKAYQQWEMQQTSSLMSDELWNTTLNSIADVFEKTEVDASVLREWGQKGFVPLRATKSLGNNMFLYLNPVRMWFLQPQQVKELMFIEPKFTQHIQEIIPVVAGLLAQKGSLLPLKSQTNAMSRRAVKDYDRIIQALVETGILESVDMHQMLTGNIKSALETIAQEPKGVIGRGSEIAGDVITWLPQKGKGYGYTPAELTNQVSLWLFSKVKWEKENPGKDWFLPENREKIAQLQSRMGHMMSGKAGTFAWQEGMLGLFGQYMAAPWKSTLQMISSKDLLGRDKAKLAAARLFWYGKYGIPLGGAMYAYLESLSDDDEAKHTVSEYAGGMTDLIFNYGLSLMDKEGEKTSVEASKSLTTVSDTVFFWDIGHDLYRMATGQPTKGKYPFNAAGSSLFAAVRDIYDLFTLPEETGLERDWSEITWNAVSFAGQLNKFSKAQLAEGITKSGNSLGHVRTRGEAIAQLSIGLPARDESLLWEAVKLKGEREKFIKEEATKIHQRLLAFMDNKSLDDDKAEEVYLKGMQSFLARVDSGYKDELITAILMQDRSKHNDLKTSLLKYYYLKAKIINDEGLTALENKLNQMNDTTAREVLKDIRNIREMK